MSDEKQWIKMRGKTKALLRTKIQEYAGLTTDIVILRREIYTIMNSDTYNDVEDIEDLFEEVNRLDKRLDMVNGLDRWWIQEHKK